MRPPNYRVAAERARKKVVRSEPIDDGDLLPVFALFWVFTVVRVGLGFAHDETFGAELTLALGLIVALPLLAKDGLRALWQRGKQVRPDRD